MKVNLVRGHRFTVRGKPTLAVVLVALLTVTNSNASAEDKKPAVVPPKIIMAMPLAISEGGPHRLTLQGQNLHEISNIKVTAANQSIEAKILEKKKVPLPPEQTAEIIGDTQVQLEFSVPPEAKDQLTFIVEGPQGTSEPYHLPITTSSDLVSEQEPNDGFTQCQPIPVGKTIVGSIHEGQNVDVYQLDGRAGDTMQIAVEARKYGSRLDSLLWLHDVRGNLLASADDQDGAVDAQLRIAIPEDGKYFLTLMDANDLGGPAYNYRLSVTSGSTNPEQAAP